MSCLFPCPSLCDIYYTSYRSYEFPRGFSSHWSQVLLTLYCWIRKCNHQWSVSTTAILQFENKSKLYPLMKVSQHQIKEMHQITFLLLLGCINFLILVGCLPSSELCEPCSTRWIYQWSILLSLMGPIIIHLELQPFYQTLLLVLKY